MAEIDWRYFLELLIGGITKGCIYALISLGYTMVYGIIELINFAHGEVYMLGAFMGFLVAGVLGTLGYSNLAMLVIAGVVAVIYCSAYGYTIEKIAYKPLRNAKRLSPLISAIGMSIFLQNYVRIAQSQDFLRYPNLVPNFSFLDPISDIITSSAFIIILSSFVVMLLLSLFIKFSRLGKAMRATAQNRRMALLLGIDAEKIISLTFIIGSALAAIGGILVASHTQQINFNIGFLAGIKAFTAAVLGGIGSIPGAMLGGLVLGVCESFAAGYFSSDYEDLFAFVILILILIFRPSGLLGKAKVQKV